MAENELFKISLDKAMSLCSQREYCCDDIRNKLLNWGVEADDSERILGILAEENFINESRYAAAFVRDKFKYNKWGKVKIESQLRYKKLPADVIRSALDLIDNEQYTKFMRDLIEGHRRTIKAKNQYDLKAKLLRYGLSKGFESTLLYDLLNDLEE
jgi:regulatory protein